jgi:hypothetical protein
MQKTKNATTVHDEIKDVDLAYDLLYKVKMDMGKLIPKLSQVSSYF